MDSFASRVPIRPPAIRPQNSGGAQQLLLVKHDRGQIGEGVWVPLGDGSLGVGFENHTSHPSIGDILFYPGGYSETEIIMAYGPCSFSSKLGQLAGNHFLTVVEGREHLPEIGRKVLWEGAQEVVFSMV